MTGWDWVQLSTLGGCMGPSLIQIPLYLSLDYRTCLSLSVFDLSAHPLSWKVGVSVICCQKMRHHEHHSHRTVVASTTLSICCSASGVVGWVAVLVLAGLTHCVRVWLAVSWSRWILTVWLESHIECDPINVKQCVLGGALFVRMPLMHEPSLLGLWGAMSP